MVGQPAWSSRFGFLMASVGFAVGLGNIWRFPYVAGENGGSAFVLVYLVSVFAIGVPILIAEIMLGRRGRGTPPTGIAQVAAEAGRSPRWRSLGHLNLLTAFTIQFVYAVVAGWVLYYLYLSISAGFSGFDPAVAQQTFDALISDVPTLFGFAMLPMLLAAFIVHAGVEKGIERAVVVLMPTLFLLLLALAAYNAFGGGMMLALDYLFTADFSAITPGVFLAAVGQAFFSIGVAMAGMMMYGAYLPDDVRIGRAAFLIVSADTAVALVAGLVIFPIVFRFGLDPAEGSGLIFQTLPIAFAAMPALIAPVFFFLLFVAAVTSLVGFFEPITAWMTERFALSRKTATWLVLSVSLTFSFLSVLSFNEWSSVSAFGRSLNAWMDFVPNQIFLPVGGLLIAFFVGWRVKDAVKDEALHLEGGAFVLWNNALKFLVVPAVAIILISGLVG